MKSALELALEKTAKKSESTKLTDAQKRKIADIRSAHSAKIAEREIMLREKLARLAGGKAHAESEKIKSEFRDEKRRIEEQMESAVAKVKAGK